jgi:hypothetical protein
MKPIVFLGMAQPYPGYSYEQVTIVASRIPDTIVAFGQTRHNIKSLLHNEYVCLCPKQKSFWMLAFTSFMGQSG